MIKLPSYIRNLVGSHGEPKPHHAEMPLFVTGAMRSGTTFLVNKLASHPQLLKIGVELNDIWTEIGGAPITGTCEYRSAEHADPKYAYQMSNYIAEFIQESKSMKRHLMRMMRFFDTNLQRVSYDWDHLIPLNKSTHLMNKLGYVHALFPDSKVILIVRDIYAHSASQKYHFKNKGLRYMPDDAHSCWTFYGKDESPNISKESCFPNNFETIPKMWMRLNHLALKEIQTLPKEQFLVISFEDLVQQQETTVEKVFQFLSLRTEHKAVEQDVLKSAAKKRNTSTEGDPLSKWKQTLSNEEIDAIDQCIADNQSVYDEIQQMLNNLKA